MAGGQKPYRVYRGGRVKGKVPAIPRPERERRDGRRARGTLAPARRRRRFGWGRRIGVLLLVLVLLVAAWAVGSYLAFRKGVEEANARLDADVAATLAPTEGSLLSRPRTILLLGTDHSAHESRAGSRRSDSIMLVRTDPRRHRLAYLSIPRDLRADVPGIGTTKVNAAFQSGGAPLAIRTIRALTGLPVNHVVVVDFGAFKALIDAVGGVDVDVPGRIVSKFDCPYATPAECARWPGWRFGKGEQHMDGRRALIYSRVRKNELNQADSDISRTERQQAVLRALTDKLTSPVTLVRLPLTGDDLLRPLATDLTTMEFSQLAWLKFRYSDDRALHCRLSGRPEGGDLVAEGDDKLAVLAMFVGASAPQPPSPFEGLYGSGCLVGRTRLATR